MRLNRPKLMLMAASAAFLLSGGAMAQCEPLAAAYLAEGWLIELCWQEVPRFSPNRMITGMRLRSSEGHYREGYFDEEGHELLRADWLALGILPKRWEAVGAAAAALARSSRAEPPPPGPAHFAADSIWVLPPLDSAKFLPTDAQAEIKGGLQISVIEDLPDSIWIRGGESNIGSWRTLSDGSRTLNLQLRMPEARGVRLHFSSLNLPEGAALLLGSPLTQEWVEMQTPLLPWSPSLPGEVVTLICTAPAAVPIEDIDVLVEQYAYRFMDPIETLKQAGNCNLDATCHSTWRDAASGVAGIASMNSIGELFCTASLLADSNPDTDIPYLLTANHCVGSNSSARSLEAYWLYQTPTCNGVPPSVSTVPRTTGGADLLATSGVSSGTDVTLLRLRGTPPAGITWLGWSAQPPSLGSSVVCIHHPRGDYKRISFGTLTNSGSPSQGGAPLQPYARFHESLWSSGTTEPGSSGSPLFLTSTRQIIGQLWGGRAACSALNEPDYYGRFDVSFPLLETWLGRPLLPFDINKDGRLNASDIQLVVNAALVRTRLDAADLDLSGMADATDIELVVTAVLHGA